MSPGGSPPRGSLRARSEPPRDRRAARRKRPRPPGLPLPASTARCGTRPRLSPSSCTDTATPTAGRSSHRELPRTRSPAGSHQRTRLRTRGSGRLWRLRSCESDCEPQSPEAREAAEVVVAGHEADAVVETGLRHWRVREARAAAPGGTSRMKRGAMVHGAPPCPSSQRETLPARALGERVLPPRGFEVREFRVINPEGNPGSRDGRTRFPIAPRDRSKSPIASLPRCNHFVASRCCASLSRRRGRSDASPPARRRSRPT